MDGNSDVGSYSYGSRPHAVTSAGGATYGYDANGNMTSGDGRTIGYGVLNKPTSITRGSRTVHLYYGPNRNRYRRVDDAGQSTETETHYVGNVEWIFKPGNVVVTKRYLNGEAIQTTTNTAGSIQRALHYLLKDHLGSMHLITDELGAIVQAQSFDAFGLRRHDDDYAALTLSQRLNFNTSFTTRGFTGHEGLDPVGLVHMNGRVYDPKLGRFVSGDPFVQDPANTQSHNRYSYVLNNPLSYTDPSGHFFKKLFKNKLFRTIASIATSAFLPVAGFMAAFSELSAAVASGFLAGLVATGGDLQGAVMGAFGAGLFYGIGSSGFLNSHRALKTAAHGLAGGTMEVLQGGKFGHGFASAFVTHTASGGIARIDAQNARFSPARVFASATLGGTVSAATGGKFANGAITGAFSRAFNDEAHARWSQREVPGTATKGAPYLDEDGQPVVYSIYGTPEATDYLALAGTAKSLGEIVLARGLREALTIGLGEALTDYMSQRDLLSARYGTQTVTTYQVFYRRVLVQDVVYDTRPGSGIANVILESNRFYHVNRGLMTVPIDRVTMRYAKSCIFICAEGRF